MIIEPSRRFGKTLSALTWRYVAWRLKSLPSEQKGLGVYSLASLRHSISGATFNTEKAFFIIMKKTVNGMMRMNP